MKQVYGVFVDTRWGVTTSKRQARAAVSREGYGEIRRMPWHAYNEPGNAYGWDAITFRLCSELLEEVR